MGGLDGGVHGSVWKQMADVAWAKSRTFLVPVCKPAHKSFLLFNVKMQKTFSARVGIEYYVIEIVSKVCVLTLRTQM